MCLNVGRWWFVLHAWGPRVFPTSQNRALADLHQSKRQRLGTHPYPLPPYSQFFCSSILDFMHLGFGVLASDHISWRLERWGRIVVALVVVLRVFVGVEDRSIPLETLCKLWMHLTPLLIGFLWVMATICLVWLVWKLYACWDWGQLHTQAKSRDLVMVRTLDSHPKAIPWMLGKPF